MVERSAGEGWGGHLWNSLQLVKQDSRGQLNRQESRGSGLAKKESGSKGVTRQDSRTEGLQKRSSNSDMLGRQGSRGGELRKQESRTGGLRKQGSQNGLLRRDDSRGGLTRYRCTLFLNFGNYNLVLGRETIPKNMKVLGGEVLSGPHCSQERVKRLLL